MGGPRGCGRLSQWVTGTAPPPILAVMAKTARVVPAAGSTPARSLAVMAKTARPTA